MVGVAQKVAAQYPQFAEDVRRLAEGGLRRYVFASRVLAGERQGAIAAQYGVTPQRVSGAVRLVVDDWLRWHGLYRDYKEGCGGGCERSRVVPA